MPRGVLGFLSSYRAEVINVAASHFITFNPHLRRCLVLVDLTPPVLEMHA